MSQSQKEINELAKNDSRVVAEQVLGVEFSDEVDIVVLQDTPEKIHLVLPDFSMNDQELQSTAGGLALAAPSVGQAITGGANVTVNQYSLPKVHPALDGLSAKRFLGLIGQLLP